MKYDLLTEWSIEDRDAFEAFQEILKCDLGFDIAQGKCVEGTVSYKNLLEAKKIFEKLVKAVREKKYQNLSQAVKDFEKVPADFKQYFANLKDFLKYKTRLFKDGVMDERFKIHEKLEAWEETTYDALSYVNPANRTHLGAGEEDINSRIDFYINNALKDFGKKGQGISNDIQVMAEKFFAAIRDFIKHFDSGTKEVGTEDTPKVFSLGRLRFINNVGLTSERIKALVDIFKKYIPMIAKFMPEVMNTEIELNPYQGQQVFVSKMNKDSSVKGYYNPGKDTAQILFKNQLEMPNKFDAVVLIHELAHKFWYKAMDASQRKRWIDWFKELRTSGETDYSYNNPEEDFAEAVAYYIFNKGFMKSKDAKERMLAIMKGRKIEAKEEKE